MTKSELVSIIAENRELKKKDVDAVLDELAVQIKEIVINDDKVLIPNLGIFTRVVRAPRVGRNPKTGEVLGIPASAIPKFKPSKNFKEAVREAYQDENE